MLLTLLSIASAHDLDIGLLARVADTQAQTPVQRLGFSAQGIYRAEVGDFRVRGLAFPWSLDGFGQSARITGAGLLGYERSLPMAGAFSFAPGLDISRGFFVVDSGLACDQSCRKRNLAYTPKGTLYWSGPELSLSASVGLGILHASTDARFYPASKLALHHSSGAWVSAEMGEVRGLSAVNAGWRWSR